MTNVGFLYNYSTCFVVCLIMYLTVKNVYKINVKMEEKRCKKCNSHLPVSHSIQA